MDQLDLQAAGDKLFGKSVRMTRDAGSHPDPQARRIEARNLRTLGLFLLLNNQSTATRFHAQHPELNVHIEGRLREWLGIADDDCDGCGAPPEAQVAGECRCGEEDR